MSTLASVRIETRENKFVVVGEFDSIIEIPRREFTTYLEALQELSRALQREEIRYAASLGRRTSW